MGDFKIFSDEAKSIAPFKIYSEDNENQGMYYFTLSTHVEK
jgi:hypothetical protein